MRYKKAFTFRLLQYNFAIYWQHILCIELLLLQLFAELILLASIAR